MKRLLIAFAVWSIAISCTPTATPPTASASTGVAEKPAINEQTRGEIQALLQKQVNTMSSKDQTGFQATIDQDRRALVRCANESYDIATRQGVGAAPQVGKIEPYLDTYVRAYVQEGSHGLRRIFFRKVDGKWVQTEPMDSELGGEKKTTVEDIQIDYWGIDQDVIDAIGKGTLVSRKLVLDNLLSDTRRDPLAIRFYPTRSVSGIQACTVVGFHLTNVASDPYVRFFRYWFNTDGSMSPLDDHVHQPRVAALGSGPVQPRHHRAAAVVAGRGMARLRRPVTQRGHDQVRPLPDRHADAEAARGRRGSERSARALAAVLRVRELDGRVPVRHLRRQGRLSQARAGIQRGRGTRERLPEGAQRERREVLRRLEGRGEKEVLLVHGGESSAPRGCPLFIPYDGPVACCRVAHRY